MKVFISWSGELSCKLAESLKDWLPRVLQSVKPFFSQDIGKGSRWGHDIAKELQDSSIGIFCITKSNLKAPWIMFEAGALSKYIDSSSVCSILFDGVTNADIVGPLTQFQASTFSKKDIKELIQTINNALPNGKLEPMTLEDTFEKWWPELEQKVQSILSKESTEDQVPKRQDREILEEILELSRQTQTKIDSNSFINEHHFKPLDLTVSQLRELNHIVKKLKDENQRLGLFWPNDLADRIIACLSSSAFFLDLVLRNSNDFEVAKILHTLLKEIQKMQKTLDDGTIPF
jgi:hypothetical protein